MYYFTIEDSCMVKSFIISFWFLLCSLCGFANVTKDINMRFKDVKHGLSHRTVNCFYQDEFGFLWVGTQDGLNRFDGVGFDTFTHDKDDPTSITMNNIRQICGNGDGLIFLRSVQDVVVYDIKLDKFSMLREGRVTSIYYANDALWMSEGDRIYKYTDINKEPELFFNGSTFDFGKYSNVSIGVMTMCQDNSLAVATTNHGVMKINEKGAVVSQTNIKSINSIMEDSRQNLWVSTRNDGLTRIDLDGQTTRYRNRDDQNNTILHDNVRQVVQANDSLLYIGSFEGLQSFNINTGEFTNYEYHLEEEFASIRSIVSMFLDRSGTLWIGTYYHGMLYYNATNDIYQYHMASSSSKNSIRSGVVSSLTEDGYGRVWFGIEGSGIDCYDKRTGRFASFEELYKKELPFTHVKSMYFDKEENNLWVASFDRGFCRINMATGRMDHITRLISNHRGLTSRAYNVVRMIDFEGTDSLIVAARGGVLVMDKKTLKLTPLTTTSLLVNSESQVWDVAFDKSGDLWFTTSHELIRMNFDNSSVSSYTFFEISQGRSLHHVNHVFCDSKGRVWVGTTGDGVYLYDRAEDSFIGYGTDEGLDSGMITGIAESPDNGTIYVSTNRGLSVLNYEDGIFENYGANSDFPLDNINEGGLFISSDNTIYAGALEGMAAVAQGSFVKQAVDYDVFVKNVFVDNRRLRPNENGLVSQASLYEQKVKLPPYTSVLSFELSSNVLNNVSNIGIEYMLEGFDKDYMDLTAHNLISYNNLKAGRYVLKVRGDQEREGGLAAPEISYVVVVKAPVYRRAWFVLLVLILVSLSAVYVLRLVWARKSLRYSLASELREKEYLEEINQSKMRFYTNVSHEFRTPLTLISSQLEMLLGNKDVPSNVRGIVKDIFRHSSRMNNIVDEVLDVRKQDLGYLKLVITKEDVVEMMKDIYESFRGYAQLKDVDIEFNTDLVQANLYIDRRQMEKVFYNLLSNAIKFTRDQGKITINVSSGDHDDVLVRVTNDGEGIAKDKIAHVFERFWQDTSIVVGDTVKSSGIGLAMSKDIVELHNGEISVESEVGAQTSFTVRLSYTANADKVIVGGGESARVERYKMELADMDGILEENMVDKDVKMLIVEDNADMRELLVQIFEPMYQVLQASNGQQGYDMACEHQPQLILSDVMMPVVSGLEMCEKIKSTLETSHIPVVLLTARGSEEHTLEGLQSGADDYVAKPFNIKILVTKCNNIIKARKDFGGSVLDVVKAKDQTDKQGILEGSDLTPLDKKVLLDASAIVESHIDDPDFNVNTFARELCMSRTLLFSKLKALTGQTPNEFVLSIRLGRATEKLRTDPSALIADIAFEFGFSSASYFIKCFKNFHGCTPAAFRKQNYK